MIFRNVTVMAGERSSGLLIRAGANGMQTIKKQAEGRMLLRKRVSPRAKDRPL